MKHFSVLLFLVSCVIFVTGCATVSIQWDDGSSSHTKFSGDISQNTISNDNYKAMSEKVTEIPSVVKELFVRVWKDPYGKPYTNKRKDVLFGEHIWLESDNVLTRDQKFSGLTFTGMTDGTVDSIIVLAVNEDAKVADVHVLSKFQPGDTNWHYNVAFAYDNLGFGTTTYFFVARIGLQYAVAWATYTIPAATHPYGLIEGSLGYPSEGIPEDSYTCAINIATKKEYCSYFLIKNAKYTFGVGYKIYVPAGTYHVYHSLKSDTKKTSQGRYSAMVPCGLVVNCPTQLLDVSVVGGHITSGIDPTDRYTQR